MSTLRLRFRLHQTQVGKVHGVHGTQPPRLQEVTMPRMQTMQVVRWDQPLMHLPAMVKLFHWPLRPMAIHLPIVTGAIGTSGCQCCPALHGVPWDRSQCRLIELDPRKDQRDLPIVGQLENV